MLNTSLRLLILAGLLIAFLCDAVSASPQEDCLSYQTHDIQLTGRILKKVFPGPPNYENIKEGDLPEEAWIIRLAKPICVKANKQDEDDVAENDVSELQLVLRGNQFAQIRRLMKRGAVTVTGYLFHSSTGHHHTAVLMWVTRINGQMSSPLRAREKSPQEIWKSKSAEPGDIHGLDFRNFRYHPACMNEVGSRKAAVKTVNGSYTKQDPDGKEETFRVSNVVYGDLNGDGMDEAVVLTDCNTGGSGWFDEGFIYAMRNGKPVILSYIQGGDRSNGGIRAARIETGLLKIERLGSLSGRPIGAEFIDTTTHRLNGSRLLRAGRPERRSLRGERRAKRIQFERGESSATLTGTTSGADFYVLGARANQTLTARISSTLNDARFEIINGDFTMAYRLTEWSGKLETRDDYYIVVVSNKGGSDYKLEVTVR